MTKTEAIEDMCMDCVSYPCKALKNKDMCYTKRTLYEFMWHDLNKNENDMPKERESMFAKYYGTPKWNPIMFRTISEEVIVTIEYEGKRFTDKAHTTDGRWNNDFIRLRGGKANVVAWMPMPEAYKGN